MSEAGVNPAPKPKPMRWVVPLLVVSLAANLLVAGILVAGYFRPPPGERMGSPSSFSQILPRSFMRELPEARKVEVRAVFAKHRDAYREDKRALRDSALAVADSLAREPFDLARAQSAIETYGARSRELVDLGMTVASEVVDKLAPEERKALAERIRNRSTAPRSSRKER